MIGGEYWVEGASSTIINIIIIFWTMEKNISFESLTKIES